MPFMMDRMEEDYEKFAARLAPHLKNPPSHFFKSGNIFVTMEVEERTAPYVLDLLRPDVLMWASDFPARARARPIRRRPPSSDGAQRSVRRIQAENALRQPRTILSFQRGRYRGSEKGEGKLESLLGSILLSPR